MATLNGQPTSPLSTTVPSPVNTTKTAAFNSLTAYDYAQFDIIDIARNATPFLYTLTRMGRMYNGNNFSDLGLNEKITNNFPEYKFKEKDEFNSVYTVNANATAAATTITLTSTSGLYNNLILVNRSTNEHFRITNVVNGTDITVQRGVGTTPAANMSVNDKLQVLASASEAGESSTSSFYVAAQDRSNYFQKIVTTVYQDDFEMFAYKINGGEDLIAEKAIQHAKEKERVALFGEKSSGVNPVTGKTYYTAEGVISHSLKGWTDDISGAFNQETFANALSNPLKYGSTKKIVLCSAAVKQKIAGLYTNMIRVDNIKNVDLRLETLTVDRGELVFVVHPELDTISGYEKVAFVLDPKHIKIVYPDGTNSVSKVGMNGKTQFVLNKSKDTFAYAEGSFVTYFTLQLENANAFGAFKIIA